MKSMLGRVLGRVGIALGVLVAGFGVATAARQSRSFPVVAVAIHASSDPAVTERGKYLVQGPGHCGGCHGKANASGEVPANDAPLSGGYPFQLPVGTFYAPNLTPDLRTGIGRYSDEDLARMLRYGVRPDGRGMLPFMPSANLADDDLTAVISYLRSTPAVSHEVAPHEINLLGNVVIAWVLTPVGPKGVPAKVAPRGATAETGKYLAHNVANCVACHTRMDMRTGELVGPLFGGGAEHASVGKTKTTYLSPNLTPDPRWGWIEGWDAQAFSARLRAGAGREGSPMPWSAFQQLSEEDARGIYLYLRSVPKAEGGPDPKQRDPVLKVAARDE